MEGIFNLLKVQDSEVLNATLEALIEIARLNYPYMSNYLGELMKITEQLMQNVQDDPKIAGYSIEIWNTLCEEEIDLKKNPAAP